MNLKTSYSSLENKVVFILGGSTGIGSTLVEEFAKQGSKVAFVGRNEEASKELLSLYEQGKLKIPYHIEDGIENFPLALQKLFTGGNTGKLMVKA